MEPIAVQTPPDQEVPNQEPQKVQGALPHEPQVPPLKLGILFLMFACETFALLILR